MELIDRGELDEQFWLRRAWRGSDVCNLSAAASLKLQRIELMMLLQVSARGCGKQYALSFLAVKK